VSVSQCVSVSVCVSLSEGGVREVLIQEGVALVYDDGRKVKEWCAAEVKVEGSDHGEP